MIGVVSCSQAQPTMKEGFRQPTVLAFVKSLATLLAILVGYKLLITLISIFIQ